MNAVLALLLAFGGGIISFASPCVLPLVPAYLSVITGLDVSAADVRARRAAVVRDTALFVTGFTVVFVLLGLTASAVGSALLKDHQMATRVAGVLVVALALFLAGSQLVKFPRLYGTWRPRIKVRRWRYLAALGIGVGFGFGWTPCIGPVLGSVLTVAATQGRTTWGAALLAAYSLGLGVPFLGGGLLLGHLGSVLRWMRSRLRGVTLASAAILGALGILLLSGQLTLLDSAAGLR